MAKQSVKVGTKGRFIITATVRNKDGELIVRDKSIPAPKEPDCFSLRCVAKYLHEWLFVLLLHTYHRKRITYVRYHYRHKTGEKILERYRTGEPSPKNLWQAIHAIIKISCPICRKYNVDPLLFGGKRNGSN